MIVTFLSCFTVCNEFDNEMLMYLDVRFRTVCNGHFFILKLIIVIKLIKTQSKWFWFTWMIQSGCMLAMEKNQIPHRHHQQYDVGQFALPMIYHNLIYFELRIEKKNIDFSSGCEVNINDQPVALGSKISKEYLAVKIFPFFRNKYRFLQCVTFCSMICVNNI